MKLSLVSFSVLLLSVLPVQNHSSLAQTAQEAHISGSPNPVGSGARALGMGGAFIGVADDATAASWNPGGLMQLETPEVSFVLSYDRLSEQRDFLQNPGASGEYSVNLFDLNYLSVVYPFTWLGKNMVVSLNYQTLYNFNRRHNYTYSFRFQETHLTQLLGGYMEIMTNMAGPRVTNLESDGYLKALSPAIAVQLTPTFSLGFTLNWFHPGLGSKWDTTYFDKFNGNIQTTTTVTRPPLPPVQTKQTYSYSEETHYHDEFTFRSSLNPFDVFGRHKKTSYNIGFLWNINRYLTLGGVYKAPFEATVRYKEAYSSVQDMVDIATKVAVHSETPLTVVADEKQVIEMPRSYGLGLAVRFSDQFTLDLDVYRTDWQHFVLRQASGRELSLITGQERWKAETEPTHQVRLGGEYLFISKKGYAIPVRAGVFYDPEPTENKPDSFYGFSLGGGIAIGSLVFDMAYQYRWGNQVRKVRLGQEEIYQDVRQHTVYASLIYHF